MTEEAVDEMCREAVPWAKMFAGTSPEWLKNSIGLDAIESEMMWAAYLAARKWQACYDRPWREFCRTSMKWYRRSLIRNAIRHGKVWGQLPEEDYGPAEPADHRRKDVYTRWAELAEARSMCLTDREDRILHMRIVEGRTLRGVGDVMGVSYERIRALQNRAIGKLRKLLLGKI